MVGEVESLLSQKLKHECVFCDFFAAGIRVSLLGLASTELKCHTDPSGIKAETVFRKFREARGCWSS